MPEMEATVTTRTNATVTGDYTPGFGGAELTAAELAVGERARSRGVEVRWLGCCDAMLVAMLVRASFSAVRMFNVDPDLWWHIKLGELILSPHKWAIVPPYSFKPFGAPWIS